jgi:argonaute-like protein implicated in RNA metabolism and viral defense
MLDEHHRSEEEEIFPQINKLAGVPGLMDTNVDEHAAFHNGLSEFMAYLGRVTGEKEDLDAEKLKGLIDSFMLTLREHLMNEVLTLKALDKYEDKTDWMAWFKKTADGLVMKQMKSSVFRVSRPNFKAC